MVDETQIDYIWFVTWRCEKSSDHLCTRHWSKGKSCQKDEQEEKRGIWYTNTFGEPQRYN